MPYKLADLIDIQSFHQLMQSLYEATGLPHGLIDKDNQILSAIGWQDICTQFHRTCPATVALCRQSDAYIFQRAIDTAYVGYKCANGLMDYGSPVIIDGERLGTIFLGQFFHEAPDENYFRQQAKKYGFDEEAYIAALRQVPVIPEERVEKIMSLFSNLAQALAQSGLERKKMIETTLALQASEEKYYSLTQNLPVGVYRIDADGQALFNNPALLKILGCSNTSEIETFFINNMAKRPALQTCLKDLPNPYRVDYVDEIKLEKNGGINYLKNIGSAQYDDNGWLIHIDGILEDITPGRIAEEKVKQQIQRLDSLRKIDLVINSKADIYATLFAFLEQALDQLQVDAGDVLINSPVTGELEFAVGLGFHSQDIEKKRICIAKELANQVICENGLVFIPDLNLQKPKGSGDFHLLEEERIVTYIGMPLYAKEQIKGVLEIYNRSKLYPGEDWFSFLDTLAGQAAIAIDNAYLFQDLQNANVNLALAHDAAIEGWAHALELRDVDTEGHCQRVTDMSLVLAVNLGIRGEDLVSMRRGALLHDIGKIGIPDHILLKNGSLTDAEWKIMQQHPVYAYKLLSPIESLKSALDIPYCHHEKWDGSGYPRRLAGAEIPLMARIFSIVDVFDALTSDRPYRKAWNVETAIRYIEGQAGKHFDPEIVDTFMKVKEIIRTV